MEIINQKSEYQSAVRGLTWLLFIELSREKGVVEGNFVQPVNKVRLSPALDYIAKNYTNQIYIKDLAFICNTSVRNFRRLFQQTFHVSPSNYITKFRVEMGGILLRTSDYSIFDIAGKSGFETLSSFNRQFKKIMGVVPKVWRGTQIKSINNN